MSSKKIKLLNDTLIVPREFIFLKSTSTASAKYAGIVEVQNADLPHFVFLSEKPISEFTAEDEERIYDLCCKAYPVATEVREKQIDLEVNEDGKVTNAKEYLNAPRFGIFAIREVENESDLYRGTGIVRREEA